MSGKGELDEKEVDSEETDIEELDSDESEEEELPIKLVISEPACKTFNFVWNIGNFKLLSENWFNFFSRHIEIYTGCCGLEFEIQRELAQKQSEDEPNSWIFTIQTNTALYKNKRYDFSGVIEEHLNEQHDVKYINSNQYLMGSNGKKKFLESGSLSKREFVIQLRDDQLSEGSEYLNSGFLEFRMELQLFKMLSDGSEIKIPKSLNPSENLAENFGCLFANQVLNDFKLETEDGSLKVHKAILAARSPVFEKMFTIAMREKEENSVTIHGADLKTMRVFLRFIYEDKLEFDESAEVDLKLSILQLAEQYQIPRLKALCELELIKSLDANSIFKILVVADTYNAKNVRESGLHFVKLNKSTLAKHDDIGSIIGNSKKLGRDILEALTSG